MSKIEIDLKKLGVIGEEVKLLEGKKKILISDLEKVKKETIELKRQVDKDIAKQQQDFIAECHKVEASHKVISEDLDEREKDLATREGELKSIDKELKKLNDKRSGLDNEAKELDKLKGEAVEKAHQAELLIEQYEVKFNELTGVKPVEPAVSKPKPKVKSKKKKR